MKKFTLLSFTASALIVSSLALTACGTIQGVQQDFIKNRDKLVETKENWGKVKTQDTVQTTTGEVRSSMGDIVSNNCPPIYIDPTLATMTEFSNMERTSHSNKISTIKLVSTSQECKVEGSFINMRIDLNFEGSLGPKGRLKTSDRPFFAYPYFIAVTDSVNVELAKEIFAASVSYDVGQDSIMLVETIRQRLPINADGSIPAYNVNVGFQLTEDQLFYNTSN